MTRIAALTDHEFTPSSRFRIRQHIAGLAQHGLQVHDHPRRWSIENAARILPAASLRNPAKAALAAGMEAINVVQSLARVVQARKFDATWLSREIAPGFPTFERHVGTPLFYDIDDAVFLNRGSAIGVRKLCSRAAVIFAGNEYLASYCRQYNSRVQVVPTAVDTDRYVPAGRPDRGTFVVGWSGSSSSFKFFAPLEPELADFFRQQPTARLKVCADRFPYELAQLAPYVDFEPWSPQREVAQIQSFDVGLMPLEDSEWSKGKCAYKVLLYAACGVPTICSPVGMNKEVLGLGRIGLAARSPSEWHDALQYCLDHRDELQSLFPDCRQVAVRRFSRPQVTGQLAAGMLAALGLAGGS